MPPARVAEQLAAEGVAPETALACARLAGGDVGRARAAGGRRTPPARSEAEAAARAALTEQDDAEWVLAAPWRPMLDRAARPWRRGRGAGQAGARGAARERAQARQRRASTREYELQARRARRRAHTAALDESLDLVATWFRDLVAVASGCEDQVMNADRLPALHQDAHGRDVGRADRLHRAVRGDTAAPRAQRARGPRARGAVRRAAPPRRLVRVLGVRPAQGGVEAIGWTSNRCAGRVGDHGRRREPLHQRPRDSGVDRGHEPDPERGQPR